MGVTREGVGGGIGAWTLPMGCAMSLERGAPTSRPHSGHSSHPRRLLLKPGGPINPIMAPRDETSAAYVFFPSCFFPPLAFHLSLQPQVSFAGAKSTAPWSKDLSSRTPPLLSLLHTLQGGGEGWQWAAIKL